MSVYFLSMMSATSFLWPYLVLKKKCVPRRVESSESSQLLLHVVVVVASISSLMLIPRECERREQGFAPI